MRQRSNRQRLTAEDYAAMAQAAEALVAQGVGVRAHQNKSLAAYYRGLAERK